MNGFTPTPESLLSFADEPVDVLRERLLRAMRYTFSWQKALGDAALSPAFLVTAGSSAEPLQLGLRVKGLQQAIGVVLDMMPPSSVFASNDAKAAYEALSADFAALYRDLSLSLATLPQRPLLDQLGDLGSAVFQAPAAAARTLAEQIAQALKNLLGGTIAALWSNLWPFILLGGAAGALYLFRAPLSRAAAKVTA